MITPVRRTASHCLGERVAEYVARSLPDAELLACDRHLVACASCRKAVDDERRMLARLAVQPMMPSDLRTALLSLASLPSTSPPPPPEAPATVRHAVRRHPAVATSRQAAAVAPARLAVLAPSAPACHRSPLRSAVLAAVAAGASAAAAWSMAVTGATATATGGPVVRPAGPAQPASRTLPSAGARDIWTVSATYTHSRLAALQAPVLAAVQTAYGTPRSGPSGARGAQSTP